MSSNQLAMTLATCMVIMTTSAGLAIFGFIDQDIALDITMVCGVINMVAFGSWIYSIRKERQK